MPTLRLRFGGSTAFACADSSPTMSGRSSIRVPSVRVPAPAQAIRHRADRQFNAGRMAPGHFHRAERMQMATTAPLDIRSISEEYFAAWEARDPDRIAAMHSADSRFQLHAGGEPAEGREAVRGAFADIFAQWPGFSFETHRVLFGEDHWVLDWD